jgi:hypothetical protein
MSYGSIEVGRLPNAAHESRPWRIHEIVPDFTLEDVWGLPAEGGAEDFPKLLEMVNSVSPANSESRATRFLWELRDRLGKWFGIGRIDAPPGADSDTGRLTIPGTAETSLAERLPEDLRSATWDVDFGPLPFVPLYRTEVEAAAEMSNQTVHGVAHVAWLDLGDGRYQGQMAVYVMPRGRFGQAYMALIKPFRYWIVYPALMRQFEQTWNRRVR